MARLGSGLEAVARSSISAAHLTLSRAALIARDADLQAGSHSEHSTQAPASTDVAPIAAEARN